MTDPSPLDPNDTYETAKRPQQAIAISTASAIVLVVACLGIMTCCVTLTNGVKTGESKQVYGVEQLGLTRFWLTGCCYGLVSGASWVAMMIRRRGAMFGVQAIVALVGAFTIERFSDHALNRYFATTLGLVVFQTVGFHFVSPIQWRWPEREPSQTIDGNHPSQYQRSQFAIFDLVACTVAAATLFTLMRRVQLGSDAAFYWIVLTWIWIIMPLVSYCCFSMVRPQTNRLKRVSWFALALIVSAVMTIAVSMGDYGLNSNTPGFTLGSALSGYARIMGGYAAAVLVFTFAASLAQPVAR